jgi:hypothetical protein
MRSAFLAFLGAPLLFSCAATSNLDERPSWVFDGMLPPEHIGSFEPDDHLSVVVLGTGDSLELALIECERKAEEGLKKMLMKATESANSFSGATDSYAETIEQISGAGASEAVSLMVRRTAWDGFEGKTSYAYGLYVIEKSEASNRLCMTVSDTYDRIKAIEDAIAKGGQTQEQIDRMALETIEGIAILGVVKDQVRSLGGATDVAWVEDFAALEQRSLSRLLDAGAMREKTGKESELRTALAFYQQAASSHPSSVLSDAISRCEARLPCGDCKGLRKGADDYRQTLLDLKQVVENSREGADLGRTGVEIAGAANGYRRTMQHSCAYFTERTSDLDTHKSFQLELGPMEETCSQLVIDSCEPRIESGTERDLEEVYSTYKAFLSYRSNALVAGQLENVKRSLPCTECQRGEKCVRCEGTRGSTGPCDTCRGNELVLGTCNICDGDGMETCDTCRGNGNVVEDCRQCSTGRLRCGSCNGAGSTSENCFGCGGSGTVWMGTSSMNCYGCNGRGQTSSNCFGCWGNGEVNCGSCDGEARITERCGVCRGNRRSGQCDKCDGAKNIDYPCRQCSDGTQFNNCSNCSGQGLCPTCSGRGHRN